MQLQLLGCLSGVEMVLKDVGYPVKLGSGVAAAAAYLSNVAHDRVQALSHTHNTGSTRQKK
jgi:hypothetical protein